MPKKKGVFKVPKWDESLPDVSQQFKVKEVPFLVDKTKPKEDVAARKKLKAKRLLSNKTKENGSPAVGSFVRAPPSLDDDEPLDPIQLGKGMKRQMSDDDDYSDDEPKRFQPSQPRRNLIKPSKFSQNGGAQDEGAMEVEDSGPWQTVQPKKKKAKAMEVEDRPQSSFRSKLVDSLKGSRFRFLNEQLYKCEGREAVKIFEDDPEAFSAYHDGYRQQVEQWPTNPLNRIIKGVRKMPTNMIVVDFGCGEARLSKEVQQEVFSVDLVAAAPNVIACDMANTPLKSESADVAVFCLSLMGTNLRDFLLEANRVLKLRGTLKVAEVASRFDDVRGFVKSVEKCGFQSVNQDVSDKLFYYFNFRKVANVPKDATEARSFSLKPCLYKKR